MANLKYQHGHRILLKGQHVSSAQPGFKLPPLDSYQHPGISNEHPQGLRLALKRALPMWEQVTHMAKAICCQKAEMPTRGSWVELRRTMRQPKEKATVCK